MRLLALIAVMGAGSAFAANITSSWHLYDADNAIALASVSLSPKGEVEVRVTNKVTFASTATSLTKEEAASLGRALLEAAGEKEPGRDCCDAFVKANEQIIECNDREFKQMLDGFTRIK